MNGESCEGLVNIHYLFAFRSNVTNPLQSRIDQKEIGIGYDSTKCWL